MAEKNPDLGGHRASLAYPPEHLPDTQQHQQTTTQLEGAGSEGRERCPTWLRQQEYYDSSDAERQSEADSFHTQDAFDDDIGSSVSASYTARPRQPFDYMSVVLSSQKLMDEHPSYHQSITAKEAERRLKIFGKDCCYLTRYSQRKKCYVLTVFRKQYPDDAIEHLGIVIDGREKYKVKGNDDKVFNGIDSMLLYYETHRISPSFPKIGQSYREDEFIRQQQQILDDEKRQEEEEKRKKEEEQRRLVELEQERVKLLKELREAKDAAQAAEEKRQRDVEEAAKKGCTIL